MAVNVYLKNNCRLKKKSGYTLELTIYINKRKQCGTQRFSSNCVYQSFSFQRDHRTSRRRESPCKQQYYQRYWDAASEKNYVEYIPSLSLEPVFRVWNAHFKETITNFSDQTRELYSFRHQRLKARSNIFSQTVPVFVEIRYAEVGKMCIIYALYNVI